MQETINKYIAQLTHLNRGYSKGLGKAPHKPILLLSVMELIAKEELNTNRILITGELILAFKNNWKKLVDTGHMANFSLPFFHLRSEPFWHLVTKPGKELPMTKSRSIKSFPKLKETIAFAELDKELFVILQNPMSRQLFIEMILETYFSATKTNFSFEAQNTEQQQLEFEILNEPTAIYQKHLAELKAKLAEDDFQEELFVRGSVFKKTVPKIYDYTCCISGMRVSSTKQIQMVDACHIYPVSISKDDTIPNGIALSPNLHRAFDRGLITIKKEYVVRVSPTLQDNNSVYGIAQFEGVNIQLPKNYAHYPSQQALAWHNKEVFLL